MKWKKIIFSTLLILTIVISLTIKFHDLYSFYTRGWGVISEEGRRRILYGNDYQLIEKCLNLPTDARILVNKKFFIANYYIYPRRIYFFDPNNKTLSELNEFISHYGIEWAAIIKDGETSLVRVNETK